MKLRPHGLAALAAALLFCAAPVGAQDAGSAVTFDGVGFTFDGTLGASVNITQVPGQSPDLQLPEGPDVPHVVFSLYAPKPESARPPRVGWTDSAVRVYPTEGLAGNDQAAAQLQTLTTLLAGRPDLATYTAVAADGNGDPLPFLPAVAAAQVFRARAAYVDLPGLSGVTYLTGLRQDVSPFVRHDFLYTFQGLSSDGQWYVSAVFTVDASMFPKTIKARVVNRIAEHWVPYLRRTVATLDAATADSFTPSLDVIDALVQSITLEGVPASEPSPLASPVPAASSAPSASPAG